MTKQRWRESLKSFIGNHIDPGKDEELKGTKEEVEGKVQKILKLLKSEHENDLDEPVTDFIEDFYKQYQSLCARYEHLTGQLKEKVNGKQRAGDSSSSSSSDSDSDNSPRKKGMKKGTLAKKFKQELETANSEVSELRNKLAASVEEKEAMKLESQSTLTKIQEADTIINHLNAEVEMWKAENSKLLALTAELKLNVEGANKIEAELDHKVQEMSREITNLTLEKDSALGRLEQGNTSLEELRAIISQSIDEKEALLLQLEVAKGESTSFKEQLRSGDNEVVKLRQLQKSTEEENESLSSKIVHLSDEINQAKDKIQDLEAESTQLREKLDEKEREHLTHVEMHEAHKSDAISRARGLELELDSLHTQIRDTEKQKEDELSAMLQKFEGKEKDMLSKIEGMAAQISNMQHETESLQVQKSEMEELLLHNSNEASGQIKDLTDQLTGKQLELETTLNHKIELEAELVRSGDRVSECSTEIETLKEEVAKITGDHQTVLNEKWSTLSKMKHEHEEELSRKSHEIRQLQEERERIQQKLSEMENTINLEVNEHRNLQKKFVDRETEANAQITALNNEVRDLQGKLDSLSSHKSESDFLLEKKSEELSEYLVQIESLKEEIATKSADEKRIVEENEGLRAQVHNLANQLDSMHEQKQELVDQIASINNEINLLREEREAMLNKISELEKAVIEKGNELFVLQKKLEDAEKESSTIIVGFTEQVDSLRQQVDSLMAEKNQLELHIDRSSQESSESLTQAEIHRSNLANKIIEQDRKMKEQEDAFSKLIEQHKQVEVLYEESKENLAITERKLEEMKVEVRKEVDAKNKRIDELEETIEDLRSELEMKADDMSTLVENVRNAEVKHRLSSQKLRITEQLLNEQDEQYKIKLEKLLGEKKFLEERIASLGHIVTIYKEAQLRLVAEISEAVNFTSNVMDLFSMKFEEDYGHMESRIHEILNDMKAATEWIKEANGEKERLVREVETLVQQLKSEKELELCLTDKVGQLEMSMSKEENELKEMMKHVKQLEEKMWQLEKVVQEKNGKIEELETKMKEKDLGISDLSEEKREAIRQLCIWIDYHRTRYDDLAEIVSKMPGARRQIAT